MRQVEAANVSCFSVGRDPLLVAPLQLVKFRHSFEYILLGQDVNSQTDNFPPPFVGESQITHTQPATR